MTPKRSERPSSSFIIIKNIFQDTSIFTRRSRKTTLDHDMSNESLQETNNKTLGTTAGTFPIVTLPDGRKVPTGTVGALLVNIKLYDEGNKERRAELEPAIQSAIPTLTKVGMFDLFAPDEWTSESSPGRALVGKLAKDYLG
jgi:hypothetical protein